MLLRQGLDRNKGADRRLGWTLAAIAGALNTAAFHAVGFFAANMTGNVSLASNRLAYGALAPGLFFIAIIGCFIGGAACATLLTNAGQHRKWHYIYAHGILIEALLMTLLGAACLLLAVDTRSILLVLGLSFLMGLQNALVTRISQARVRTTHVSGMSTDIGIELAMLVGVRHGTVERRAAVAYRNKLVLHSQTLLAFLLGGIVGALVYQQIGLSILFVCALLLALMAGHSLWRGHRHAAADPNLLRPQIAPEK